MFLHHHQGQITSRDLVITGSITLGIALVILVVFIIISGRGAGEVRDGATLDLINQIKEQSRGAGDEGSRTQPNTGDAAEDAQNRELTVTGVVRRITGNVLTVEDATTKAKTDITLTDGTVAVYNGSVFDTTDFYEGDQLTVRAIQSGTVWEAVAITVRFSASPETSAPVPNQLEERPDGSLKPLGNS